MQKLLFVFLFGVLLCPLESQALDTDCLKKQFAKYTEARVEFQRYPLQHMKDQPAQVQKAVTEEVDYQLSYIAVEKTAFDAILAGNPALLVADAPLSRIIDPYTQQHCTQTGPQKCEAYTLMPHPRVEGVLSKDAAYTKALETFNVLNAARMKQDEAQKQERKKKTEAVYTKELFASMMADGVAKTWIGMAQKTPADLGCH